MAVYWSPSERRFIDSSGQRTTAPPQHAVQANRAGQGKGNAPTIYYSPSTRELTHSFDGRTIPRQPEGYDGKKNQDIIQDILRNLAKHNEHQAATQKARAGLSTDLSPQNATSVANQRAAGVPEQKSKEGILGRTIDILSRTLYGTANVGLGRVEQSKDQQARLDEVLSPSQKQAQQRIQQKDANPNRFGLGILGKLTGQREDPIERSVREKTQQIKAQTSQGLDRDFDRFRRGIEGKDKVTWREVIDAHDPDAPNWVKGSLGFVGDVVLDPLILVPGAVFVKPISVGARTVKKVTPAGRSDKRLADALGKQADDLRAVFARELQEGTIDSRLFERVVSKDPKITGAQRITAAREISKEYGRGFGIQKFSDIFEANLGIAVREGRITEEYASQLLANRGQFSSLDDIARAAEEAAAKAGPTPGSGRGTDHFRPDAELALERAAGHAEGFMAAREAGVEAAREGARRFVGDLMERGRISSMSGRVGPEGKASIRETLEKLDKRLKSVGLETNFTKQLTTPALKAKHASYGTIQKWSNELRMNVQTGRSGSGKEVLRSIKNVMHGTEASLKYSITRALGQSSNAATKDVGRAVDEFVGMLARPDRAAYLEAVKSGDKAVLDAYKSWHAALFEYVAKSLRTQVTDEVTEAIFKQASNNPEILAKLTELGGGVASIPVKAAPKVDEAISRFPPAMTDEAKAVVKESKQQAKEAMDAASDMFLDFVAKSDARSFGKTPLAHPKQADEYLRRVAERDLPLAAQKSFNGFIKAFNSTFRAKAGLDPRMNELRLRYMGMANENVQYRAKLLKDMFKGTTAKGRTSTFNAFRTTGQLDEAGTVARFRTEMEDILKPYTSEFAPHSFGPEGRMTLGDLSRWLPEKYKIPFDNLIKGDKIKTWEDAFNAILPGGVYGKAANKTDPAEVLWSFMIANEKVIAEKAVLRTMADVWGVTKENLAGMALTGRRAGYVNNKKFGDEYFFHPEISRQIDQFFNLVHSPRPTNALISYLDRVNNTYKQAVTTFNPVGFNTRNSMGDAFTGYLDGVKGPRGLASYRQAGRVMTHRNKISEQAQEAIHTPGAKRGDLGGGQALFRLRSGESVSLEETMLLYNKHGLNSAFIQTEFEAGFGGGRIRSGGRAVKEPFQKLAQTQADFFRYGHFIDRMKRSKAKNVNDAAQEAAQAVRKFKFDYNDYTPFEKVVLSRVIPFYKFSRKNLPLMAQMMFAQPARMNIMPKGMTAVSSMMGYEPEGFHPDFDASSVIPQWIRNREMWPIFEHDGDHLYAQPDIQLTDLVGNNTWTASGAASRVTPALKWPTEMITGETLFDNKTTKIKDRKRHLIDQIPATRDTARAMEPDRRNLGQLLQSLGFGTTQVTDRNQESQIKADWAQFFGTPAGKAFADDGPQKEISEKQIKYLLDLMAQENSVPR